MNLLKIKTILFKYKEKIYESDHLSWFKYNKKKYTFRSEKLRINYLTFNIENPVNKILF